MIHNEATYGLFVPDKPASEVTRDEVGEIFQALNALPVRVGGPGGHQQRDPLPGQRRRPLHHRRPAAGRRRLGRSSECRPVDGRSGGGPPQRRSTPRSPGDDLIRRRPGGHRPPGHRRRRRRRCARCAAGWPGTWSAGSASSTCCWPRWPPAGTCCSRGRPGTSKSTLLRAITAEWGIPLVFVEGNADLTPTRLVGHHDPARVLREDYTPDNFVPGPLVEAMRVGRLPLRRGVQPRAGGHPQHAADRHGRAPDRHAAGRHGRGACPAFRVIASMNPYDNVGHDPAVDVGARPAVPAGDRLPGRRGRAGHRRPAHRRRSRRGWSPTPSR